MSSPSPPVTQVSRRSKVLVILGAIAFPLIVAAVVYVVSNSIPATYESNGSFRVTIPDQQGSTTR